MNTPKTDMTAVADAHVSNEPLVRGRGLFMLAELCWGDDAYAEHVPAAILIRVSAQTLVNIDHVWGLIDGGVLSQDGAYVAVAEGDAALLACVSYTAENALAPVPGFFNPEHDQVIFLLDSNNMHIDGERADFRSECEVFSPHTSGDISYVSLRVQKDPVFGITLSASGSVGSWNLNGYMERWPNLRALILSGWASAQA